MIYRKPPFRWQSVTGFLIHGFPQVFRRNLSYVIVSTGIFVLFGLVGFVLGLEKPGFIELVVPEHIIETVEKGRVWFSSLYTMAPAASSGLMTHNISVTFFMAASGITFGIGSVYLLSLNGLLIGAASALCFKHSLSLEFWSFVLPHGSLELTAVFIAGASGLIFGHALLDPGPYKRSEYLSLKARKRGCWPGMRASVGPGGLIEGFFSPSPLPAWFKLVFAGVSFSALMAFLLFSGSAAFEDEPDLKLEE